MYRVPPVEMTSYRPQETVSVQIGERTLVVGGVDLSAMTTGYDVDYAGPGPEVTVHLFAPLLAQALGIPSAAVAGDVIPLRFRAVINPKEDS